MTGLMTGCMNSISTNVYIDKLDDIVKKYNNKYHRAIKMKPVDLKWRIYIHSNKKINDKDPKFKIGNIVRISRYKNAFAKGYAPIWSQEVFLITKVKNTLLWIPVISDIKDAKKLLERFTKKIAK